MQICERVWQVCGRTKSLEELKCCSMAESTWKGGKRNRLEPDRESLMLNLI